MQKGSLVCVGTGMTLGSHISPLARSYIEQADVVFVLGLRTGFNFGEHFGEVGRRRITPKSRAA